MDKFSMHKQYNKLFLDFIIEKDLCNPFNYKEGKYRLEDLIYKDYDWFYDNILPNFENKKTGFKIWWYKHPCNYMESNFQIKNIEDFLYLIGKITKEDRNLFQDITRNQILFNCYTVN